MLITAVTALIAKLVRARPVRELLVKVQAAKVYPAKNVKAGVASRCSATAIATAVMIREVVRWFIQIVF